MTCSVVIVEQHPAKSKTLGLHKSRAEDQPCRMNALLRMMLCRVRAYGINCKKVDLMLIRQAYGPVPRR
jgi:hypothetical protein